MINQVRPEPIQTPIQTKQNKTSNTRNNKSKKQQETKQTIQNLLKQQTGRKNKILTSLEKGSLRLSLKRKEWMKGGGEGHHWVEKGESPWPCLASASATKIPALWVWTQEQIMLEQNFRQLYHMDLICQGTPISLLKALTTCKESVSKQMLWRFMCWALSMADIHALNSASKGEAWPMLLTIAPKK